MKINKHWPSEVFKRAHREYPNAVSEKSLYGVAFFGHARPSGLDHNETTGSIWRGLCRKHLRQYTAEYR